MTEKYVITQVEPWGVSFGASYMLFELQRDFNHEYYVPVKHVENDPVTLAKARERLEALLLIEEDSDYGFDPALVGNRSCPGTMQNRPNKSSVRCNHCHRIDWELNEGDPCPRKLGEAHS